MLTSGGNEENSPHRIVPYFKKDHSTTDNAVFLKKEYSDCGKGFIFGGNKVSVWFGESGIRIAVGDTATNSSDASLVTWEQSARRIRELLNMGRFAPQSELYKADGNELKELAENFWYLERDLADNVAFDFVGEELFKDGFPDSTARIAEFLAQPEQREEVLAGLQDFAAEYEQNNDLLRFYHSVRYLRESLTTLEDLQREPLTFTADESVSTPRPGFITQDEIDRVLCGGGNVENGRYRIYSYFLHEHTAKEKVDFLKEEYGTGGFGRTGFDEWHDSKGIAYSRENNHMPYDKVILPWNKVATRIDELIADGRYLSEQQLAYLPEYEKTELAREIHNFYPRQPEDLPRPFPREMDYWQAVTEFIRPQLDEPERVTAILESMAAVLDNTADFDRNYEDMQKAFADLTAYQNGEYTLFPKDKPAERQQAVTDTAQTIPAPSPQEQPAADEAAVYDLQFGSTVYLGTDE